MNDKERTELKNIITLICTENGKATLTDFLKGTESTRKDRTLIRELADELTEEGIFIKTGGGRYSLKNESVRKSFGTVEGEIRITAGGSGFVRAGENLEDIYVSPENIGPALDGDTVFVSRWPGNRGPEGRVDEITRRGREKLAGILKKKGKSFYLEPDDPRINHKVMIKGKPARNANDKVVLAQIDVYPESRTDPMWVSIDRIIGEPGILTTEVEKTVILSGILDKWNEEIEDYVKCVPAEVSVSDKAGRVDLRSLPLMTIDPKDARDFDDAVHVEKAGGKYTLHVAIADVSHYVVPETPVDVEARKRGLSIYIPDRSIPMLHSSLSSGICSLKPDVERLCMVAKIIFSEKGKRLEYEIFPAVMKSHARLCYEDVALVIKTDPENWETGEVLPQIQAKEQIMLLYELAGILHKRRLENGALELDIPEAKVILDEDDPLRVRDVLNLRPDPHLKAAYNVVEEAMLAANEAVGDFVTKEKLNVPWRIHEVPDEEKMGHFKVFATLMGIKASDIHTDDMSEIIKLIMSHESPRPLFYNLLRSMKQAVYSEKNVGHFALASETYLHFTSPIRRYPDLAVHRALKAYWFAKGKVIGNEVNHGLQSPEEASRVSFFTTAAERKAVELERKVTDIYRAWFMRPHIGDVYEAVVSGITTFGIFSTIEHPFIEGLTRYDWLDDEIWEFIQELGIAKGMKENTVVLPGDKVKIMVAKCDIAQGQISFEMPEGITALLPERDIKVDFFMKEIKKVEKSGKNPVSRGRSTDKSRNFDSHDVSRSEGSKRQGNAGNRRNHRNSSDHQKSSSGNHHGTTKGRGGSGRSSSNRGKRR
ncbi:MAG: VacB/RNase II family 3'-5' exoribonuclease [Deltaproteobacteria bacterium]|nr:VacB/RNase II family 3'-5' exoribonuclease [Deltaproteobacteria bacterium]